MVVVCVFDATLVFFSLSSFLLQFPILHSCIPHNRLVSMHHDVSLFRVPLPNVEKEANMGIYISGYDLGVASYV